MQYHPEKSVDIYQREDVAQINAKSLNIVVKRMKSFTKSI